MSDDHRRPAEYASERRRRLRRWLRSEVAPYSQPIGPALSRARRAGSSGPGLLGALAVTSVAALGDGRAHVLEPTVEAFGRTAALSRQARFLVADVTGRRDEFAHRYIDPEYKPVLWTVSRSADEPLYVAHTSLDLDRLGRIGRRALSTSGVRADDRILLLDHGPAGIPHWQLVLGCRNAGVALLRSDVDGARALATSSAPTVVAGPAVAVRKALEAGVPPGVRLLVVDATGAEDDVVALAGHGVPIAEWFAPAPVRAAWVRCPGGDGFHTWPTHELVEVLGADDRSARQGRLVWSAVGWHGSVWLRVDTGHHGALAEDPCPTCTRTTPRVVVS